MSKHRQSNSRYKAAVVLCLLLSLEASAAERGAVTAIASLSAQNSAFIGFASGAVFYCTRLGGCTQLEGTPESAVTSLDAPSDGNNVKAWVGYENGSVYFCTLTGGCTLQDLTANPGKSKLPS